MYNVYRVSNLAIWLQQINKLYLLKNQQAYVEAHLVDRTVVLWNSGRGSLALQLVNWGGHPLPSTTPYGCVLVMTSAAKPWRPLQELEAQVHGWMALTLTKILVQICLYCV